MWPSELCAIIECSNPNSPITLPPCTIYSAESRPVSLHWERTVNEPISLQTLNQLGLKTHIHCHTGEITPERQRELDKWKIETESKESKVCSRCLFCQHFCKMRWKWNYFRKNRCTGAPLTSENVSPGCWKQVRSSFKGMVHPKMKIQPSFILALKLFQTCMSFFLLLNTKEDILKNVGNQTADDLHWLPYDKRSRKKNTMEVDGDHQMFGYQHSSKYLWQMNWILIDLEQLEGE